MKRKKGTGVCIVVENLPVPLDRRVWREASALRNAGYRVAVICPKGPDRFSESHELLDGVEIYRHRAWEASNVLGYLWEYLWATLAEAYLTLKVFRHMRFRILQACNPPDTIFLLALLLRPFGVRFIFDHHDLAPELFESKFGQKARPLYWLTRLFEFCSFQFASACIATNESFKEIAVRRGRKRPDNVFVVRNCPELTSMRPQHSLPDAKQGKRFLVAYVGFMGPQDGLDLLIDSIRYMVHDCNRHDTHFLLIGRGTELPSLQRAVASAGLESFVTFTGQVPYEMVSTYLSSADIGVAPDPKTAMNDQSTMIKIMEYMACGLPVVLFDLKEGRRIAGPSALYASPNDPVDFARKITTLLDCESLRRQLGERGRHAIENRLNWDAEKATLLEAYSTVAA